MNTKFAKDEQIEFANELGKPYTIRAIGSRYAVLTRPLCDSDLEEFGIDEDYDYSLVYTILDSENWMRGPHNLILNPYDFETDEGCEECLQDVQSGQIELSRRRTVDAILSSLEIDQP